MNKNNPSIVATTKKEEPIDCKPISFGKHSHPCLLELQQPYTHSKISETKTHTKKK